MRGSDILPFAAKRVGDSYRFGAIVDYRNSRSTGPWDCAEYATWCTFQAYGFLFGCDDRGSAGSAFTGEWKQQSATRGKQVSVEEAKRTPGAFLLRFPGSGGIAIGHVVISTGDGSTLEAADRTRGVIRGTTANRRWDTGFLLPGVDYETATAGTASDGNLRFQEFPQFSKAVMALQEALTERGFDPGTIDGLFGESTEAAVAAFQHDAGLVVDGEAGPSTLGALALPTSGLVPTAHEADGDAPAVPLKSTKLDVLADEYEMLFRTTRPRADNASMIEGAVGRMLAGKPHYEAVADGVGSVPWYVVGVINELESTSNFATHLHNGDPLNKRTVHVPRGHPRTGNPPFTWDESAIDALKLKDFHTFNDWGLPSTLHRLEKYNGFGSRERGVHSPYLWSCSTHYTKGKFVADHEWDPEAVSKQVGAGVILFVLEQKGEIRLPH